jgi:MscS family membrane protein
MDFLDKIYLDNSVRSYVVVLGTILFVLIFKRLLSRYVAALIYQLIKRTWAQIKQEQFIKLIVKPLGDFIVIAVAVIAIDKLNFPTAWGIKIYHHPLESIINKIGYIIVIVAFVKFVVSLVHFVSLVLQEAGIIHDKEHNQLIIFFRDFFKVITYIAGLLLLLKIVLNVNVGAFVAGLGIAGAALALAAKESIENIIASFIIFLDKPFFTGDTVKVNAFSGKVERIGLRSTRIRTNEKTLITVPNKQMVDSVVDNLSFRNFRRAEIKLEFSATTEGILLNEFTSSVKAMLSNKNQLNSYSVLVSDFSKSGIIVTTEFFALPIPLDEFSRLKEAIIMDLMKLVHDSEIQLATSQSNITILNSDPGEDAPSKSQPII